MAVTVIIICYYLFSFQYSGKVSSQTSTASSAAVVAKPQNSVASETPVVTTKPLSEITATSDVFVPKTSVKRGILLEDKQWHELRIDYSKLIQHYLMLSKIRLTCRYHNLCHKIIQVYLLGHRLDSHRSGVQFTAWIEIFCVLQNCLYQYVEIKCQLDATDDFYCRSYCLLNMFRAPLCPSSGAREYYTSAVATARKPDT